jgi:hypothetical protein
MAEALQYSRHEAEFTMRFFDEVMACMPEFGGKTRLAAGGR